MDHPCRSPYCECTKDQCNHPGFFDARHYPFAWVGAVTSYEVLPAYDEDESTTVAVPERSEKHNCWWLVGHYKAEIVDQCIYPFEDSSESADQYKNACREFERLTGVTVTTN